jgi:YfiH family protein
MLQRRTAPNGVVIYVSPKLETLGVPHAFSTRIGGTSPPPFDSFNLGNPIGCGVQDDYPRILSHYPLLQSAAGCPVGEWCRLHQVHGPGVVRVKRGEPFDRTTQGDALVSDDPTRSIAVRAADCVPILIADRDSGAVAAVHAGWRGTCAGAVGAAVSVLGAEFGSSPADLVVAIGPSIGVCCYEVGPELVDAFAAAGYERYLIDRWFTSTPPPRGSRARNPLRLDVAGANRDQLILAGVPEEQVHLSGLCTAMHLDVLTSYRVEKEKAGRLVAAIRCSRT